MTTDFPTEEMELTNIRVICDIERSRQFYKNVLGATVFREYGGTSCVLKFLDSWLLLVTGGEPTKDKPGVNFVPPGNLDLINHSMTIRVPDCKKAYEILKKRGAKFLTPPVDCGLEIRCFFTDPDGHLFEISQLA